FMNLQQLPDNLGAQVRIGQNPQALRRNQRTQALDGSLNKRRFAYNAQHLLGTIATAERPKASAPSTGQNQAVMALFRHEIADLLDGISVDQPKRPAPARLGKEVLRQVDNVVEPDRRIS